MRETTEKRQGQRANAASHNLMLTIDQISQLTGVAKSTLRYWEKTFDLFLKPNRTPTNRREYSVADLGLVETIQQLLDQEHLTMRGVRLRLMDLSSRKQEKGGRPKAKGMKIKSSS